MEAETVERPTAPSVPARGRRPGGLFAAAALLTTAGLVVLLCSVAVAVTVGPADVSLVNVRDIVTNHLQLTDIPVHASEDAIVWQERLPRALVAAACGAGLGVCGAILQSLLRNPLADPFILGVSSGASPGAVLVGVLGLGGTAIGLSGAAFIGALVAFALVLLLARYSSGGTGSIVLAGVASTQLFSALTSLTIFAFADSDEARGVMFWLLGSLEGMRLGRRAAHGRGVCGRHRDRLPAPAFAPTPLPVGVGTALVGVPVFVVLLVRPGRLRMSLHADRVSWRRGGALVVDEVTLTPRPGETVGLLGPNGSGKSSLLRLLQGAARPDSGTVLLDGEPIDAQGRRAVAQKVAAVTQHADTDTDITTYDVVRLGCTPYRSPWVAESTADHRAIRGALERVEPADKADRMWRSLSGGERQRAHIARALAQEPRALLLDEPTNHLDIRHQLDLLHLVRTLEVTSIVAIHDLNLAAMFCDSVIVLARGRAVAAGTPKDVLTPQLIKDVYEVDATVGRDEVSGRITVSFTTPGSRGSEPLSVHLDRNLSRGSPRRSRNSGRARRGPARSSCPYVPVLTSEPSPHPR